MKLINEEGGRLQSTTSVCLLCSQLPRWLNFTLASWAPTLIDSIFLIADCWLITALVWTHLLVAYLSLLISECSPPWSRFLVYRLGDTLSKGSEHGLAYPLLRKLQQFCCLCWLGNFLGNGLSIYSLLGIASCYSVWAGTCPIVSRCVANDHIRHNILSRFWEWQSREYWN
jgi:hypothetical protein